MDHGIKCPAENCNSSDTQKRGTVKKFNTPRYYCNECGHHFSIPRLEKEIIRFYRVRTIQLFLEGIEIPDIAKYLNETEEYIYSLLGGEREMVNFLRELRLNPKNVHVQYSDLVIQDLKLKEERNVFTLDGINVPDFGSFLITHDEKYIEHQRIKKVKPKPKFNNKNEAASFWDDSWGLRTRKTGKKHIEDKPEKG